MLAGILFSIMAVCAPCLIDVFIHHKSVFLFSIDVPLLGNQIQVESCSIEIK